MIQQNIESSKIEILPALNPYFAPGDSLALIYPKMSKNLYPSSRKNPIVMGFGSMHNNKWVCNGYTWLAKAIP